MLLIYSAITSPRLQYICSFIFKEGMQVDIDITTDAESFRQYDGIKINYSAHRISNEEVWIPPVTLLFENNIQPQPVDCFETGGHTAFFKTENGDLPFDVLAASFYLLSRYEEYLPHRKDVYGRFAHENALAFTKGFLQKPLINFWLVTLIQCIRKKFAAFNYQQPAFSILPTYDIDMAYAYQHKGIIRSVGGFLTSASAERIKVIAGKQTDPFDAYAWMDALHKKYGLQPVYFFLVAAKNGRYDKNIFPANLAMQQIIVEHAAKYSIGIHPSWQSGDEVSLLTSEKQVLEKISKRTITASRQHYIRFDLPRSYRQLLDAGITDDYSMGYGSINGFRASAASSFYWFDLQKNQQTTLRIHPFCFMDANAFYEQRLSPTQAFDELLQYYTTCKAVNGTLISIWHNNFLGTGKQFAGWRECYEKFIALVQAKSPA